MGSYIDGNALIRAAQRQGAAMGERVSLVSIQKEVGAVTAKAIGLKTDRWETVVDQRDGREVQRPVLEWLPKSRIRIVGGKAEPGEIVTIELPQRLAAEKGLAP